MRISGSRRVVGGLVAAMLSVAGVFGVLAASSGATGPGAKPAAVSQLGSVAALAWGVQTPVGARLVLRPSVSFNLPRRALRVLGATKPRLSGSFVARIVTTPARGRGRTLVVVSRRVNGLALRAAAVRSILGRQLQLRQWVLTHKRTEAVKRAARVGLAISLSARYSVSYVNARGRRVVTPPRSASVTLPIRLRPQTGQGGNLGKLAVTFRALLGRVGQLRTACVTSNSILEELRSTYDAMVSGDRTGAAGLLSVYIHDAETMRRDGLLTTQQASIVASGLGAVLGRVGTGQSKRVESPRRWLPLRSCLPSSRAHIAGPRAHVAGPLLDLALLVVHRVVKVVRQLIEIAGKLIEVFPAVQKPAGGTSGFLRTIFDSMWPINTTDPSVNDLVPPSVTAVQPVLDDLKARLNSFLGWEECCLATQPGEVASQWNALLNAFTTQRMQFQSPASEQVNLLPLFTQYENMYLSALREGVVNGPRWGMSLDATLSAEDQIRSELDASNPSSAMSYSNNVYNAGLATLKSYPTDPEADFNSKNAYRRDMQLEVLDFRDLWHLQDPMSYPFGDPGFKEDRIIYSDEIGRASDISSPFSAPANPSTPLSAITVWTTRIKPNDYFYYHYNQNWVTAVQADNSPQVGARTGSGLSGTPTTYDVAPGSAHGPVVQVGTTWEQKDALTYPHKLIGTMRLYFSNVANGSYADPGGNFYTHSSYPKYSADCCTTYWSFDGEVLATAKVAGHYDMISNPNVNVADGLVLGFRLADSYSSHWNGSLPGKVRAFYDGPPFYLGSTNFCLAVPLVAMTSGSHLYTNTGSRTPGSVLQMTTCDGGWEQTWHYVDYNDPNDPSDDTAQHELTVYAGTMCMAPATDANGNWATGGSFPTTSSTTWPPPAHTLVAAYNCEGTDRQKWDVRTDGTIRLLTATNMCLSRRNGALLNTQLELDTCKPPAEQLYESEQWVPPAG